MPQVVAPSLTPGGHFEIVVDNFQPIYKSFNPRARDGRDIEEKLAEMNHGEFQSTRP